MNPPLAVNSRCRTCQRPVLWAELPSGTTVPLDRSPAGPIRLIRGDKLRAEFLSTAELKVVFGQQREATERGDVPEQLYALHPEACRAAARAARSTRRPRRKGRKGGRR